jgi:iron complex outermembrane recepter protein
MGRIRQRTNEQRTVRACLLAGTALLASGTAWAQSANQIEEIQVFAQGSRLPVNITSVPGSVTVIDQKSLAQQTAITSDLGRVLASQVPGMAVSSNDGNNYAQTLRGRKPSFFIDGIPQSADLRAGGRDLRLVNPAVLQRIEVINGATSIYGLGGSGGVVNYITKRPSQDGLELTTEVGLANSLSHMSSNGLEYSLSQSVSGKQGRVDFIGNISYVSRGLYYDAKGAPIPPDPTGQTGIADSGERTIFGKLGVEITPDIRWETMFINYDLQVDTDYTVGQGSFINGVKSVAVPKRKGNLFALGNYFDFVGTQDPSTRNTMGTTALLFEDVYGSQVKLSGFAKDSIWVWRYLSYVPASPSSGGFPPSGSQLKTFDQRRGARLDIRTPLNFQYLDGTLLWGLDYTHDSTEEKLVDGRPRTSRITQDNVSGFGQLQVDIFPWLHARTGFRYDYFDLSIPSFKAMDTFSAALTHSILGADLSYTSRTGNFGLVADLNENFSVFGSWSSGFSIGNVVRAVSGLRPSTRVASPVTYDLKALNLVVTPVQVDSYEGGVRYKSDRISASATGFINTSKLGASFDSTTLQVTRAPEEIWGYELTASVKLLDTLRAGGTYTWLRSHTDTKNNGIWNAQLDFSRVPPPILNAYVEYDLPYAWTSRLQSTTLFSQHRFNRPWGSNQRDVSGYTVFDVYFSGPIGPGTLSVGVENVFNRQYFPLVTYLGCSENALFDAYCATAAPGARGTLKYSVKY